MIIRYWSFHFHDLYIIYHKQSHTYLFSLQEQDKSSDIEQQPLFGDRKESNTQPKERRGGYKTNGNII